MANIPALTIDYGKSSYWDELNQKRAQGYSPSSKQLTALAYGERYGELANEMNRQKINRQLALDELKLNSDIGYKNRLLDINKDTSDKQWYGQLTGLGISALMNWDKLMKGFGGVSNTVQNAYNWINTPALPEDFVDQYGDFSPEWSLTDESRLPFNFTDQWGNFSSPSSAVTMPWDSQYGSFSNNTFDFLNSF